MGPQLGSSRGYGRVQGEAQASKWGNSLRGVFGLIIPLQFWPVRGLLGEVRVNGH